MKSNYSPSYLLVKWTDARKSDRSHNLDGFQAGLPVEVWSVGFGHIRDDAIVLAQDFFPLEAGDIPGDESFRQLEIIPRSCILEITMLELPKGTVY